MPANQTPNDGSVLALPTLAELDSSTVAEQARLTGEPDWLIDWRVQAWEHFAHTMPPLWKRTNLSNLHPESISTTFKPQGTAVQWDAALENTGVVFTTLAAALHSHGDLIRTHLGTAIDPLGHKFSALRAALWQDGVFLYVPKNADIEVPLRAIYTLAAGQRATFPYTLIVLEDNARVAFIEEYTSPDLTEHALCGATTEIFLGAGSQIRFASVQHWGEGVYHIGGQRIVHGRDSSSEWTTIALGGSVQHIEAEARMVGDGSRVAWLGATFANQQQNLVVAPWLRHIGAHTESDMEFKTVVTDKAYSVFDGMIKIEHESRATVTRLEEKAVHLKTDARSDSIPGLMIDTNDVARAGHASTSGQVDDEQLFYMQTRGIQREDAIRLIVMGFFEPALLAIAQEELRDQLTAQIEAKI